MLKLQVKNLTNMQKNDNYAIYLYKKNNSLLLDFTIIIYSTYSTNTYMYGCYVTKKFSECRAFNYHVASILILCPFNSISLRPCIPRSFFCIFFNIKPKNKNKIIVIFKNELDII